MSPNANKFVGVREDSFARPEYDNWVVGWDIVEQFITVFIAPLFVWHCLKRTLEVKSDIVFVERVIDAVIFAVFLFVKIMAKGKIEAGLTDVPFVKWYGHDSAVGNRCFDFGITVNAHDWCS